MQQITVGQGWALEIFGAGATPGAGTPGLPRWIPAESEYLPARLRRINVADVDAHACDLVAAWPKGVPVPDPDRAATWTDDDLAGVLLVHPREGFRCRVCGGRVNALYPDGGLPSWGGRHRYATHCPLCGSHVDQARLHALALFAP
ncbi:hypothetical protein [Actinocorallia herbida]|uniref:hypothetical protein n=1 Tax=Actinocorallia herbida TaxID=58109 RepID=UPI0011CE8742|nr:hypothetical protein [Actinocorallia herbida]